ncbi:MAG: YraN family protein [Labrys sp. (in: a-proteobacteria)]
MNRDRRSAQRFGLAAEARAGWLLRLKGYRILDRRVRTHGGEIDLVVRRGRTLVFVEVKARASLDDAAEAIRGPQMRRIGAAARAWLGRHPADHAMTVRFDAVHVAPARWPRHIVNAFEIDIW